MTKSTNFFSSNKHSVSIIRLPDVELFCNKITLPDVTVANFDVDGHLSGKIGLDSHSNISYSDLIATFWIDENMENYISVIKWLKTISPDDDLNHIYPESLSENEGLDNTWIEVEILDNNQKSIGKYRYLVNPTNLSGLELDVSEDASMTATVTFHVTQLDFDFIYSKIKTNENGYKIPSHCNSNKCEL